MIRHHHSGIPMADAALAQCRDRHVRDLARAIRAGQLHEIQVMTDLLTARGATPLPR